MAEFWLDLGSGMDAEHWAATEASRGVRRVAMDPLITSGMIASSRLATLSPDILRVGGEIRPEHSVESGKALSFLPFRSGAFTRVRCGFVLHLYLEVLDLLAEETFRVLAAGGDLAVLLPHFGDGDSERTLRHTRSVLERCYGEAVLRPFEGPFTTFWADLYRGRSFLIRCRKPS